MNIENNSTQHWATIIADTLERNLERLKVGQLDGADFVGQLSESDERLWDAHAINDRALRAAWLFGDSFFHHAEHSDEDMAGIPWSVARTLVEDTIGRLRAGDKGLDPRVLRFPED